VTNSNDDYWPKTQEEKAAALGVGFATPVEVDPNEPYPTAAPPSPPEPEVPPEEPPETPLRDRRRT
jgi:hypothetical protein